MKQYVKTYLFSTLISGIALLATSSDASARYCREYTQNIMVGGRIQEGYSTACMQPDGSWQEASNTNSYDYYERDSGYRQPVGYTTRYMEPAPIIERRVTVVQPAPILPLFNVNLGHYPHRAGYWPGEWPHGYKPHDHGHGHRHGHKHGDGYPSHAKWKDDDRHEGRPHHWGERRVYVDRRHD